MHVVEQKYDITDAAVCWCQIYYHFHVVSTVYILQKLLVLVENVKCQLPNHQSFDDSIV